MKRVTIGQAQHNFSELIRMVNEGEELVITKRKRVVARLVRATDDTQVEYPRFLQRARETFGNGVGTPPGLIITDDRSERI